ncbi:nuclear transport factor 2 family protein [Bradyrhizobium sp.]|uniref:nuclear transport factor 2 family protein n=1 Tax=Bradyrhizobium sp. TaxID=376 RepID=UPI0039E4D54F
MRDFDQMGIVIDWVDACRTGDLAMLLDLYADDAQLECSCNGTNHYRGRSELETYWQPRLNAYSTAGFGLEEISPVPNGVDVEYSVAGSLRIHATFRFSPEGKIYSTVCEPARQNPPDRSCC